MNKFILIDKEEDYTSRDVVNILCRQLKTKKVGHTGTLDPLATGVLVICVGRYTKLVDLITSYEKVYETKVVLGLKTDTLDITGKIIDKQDFTLDENKLKEVLESYVTTYMQQVPIYSAVKVNGRKLYEYARANEEVVLPKKEVTISSIELLDVAMYNENVSFTIRTKVSKGTYIRALIDDIGASLNTVATMVSLRRIKQGGFDIRDCVKLNDDGIYNSLTVRDILDVREVVVEGLEQKDILNGKIIPNIYNEELILFVDKEKEELALYKVYDKDNNMMKPYVMLK